MQYYCFLFYILPSLSNLKKPMEECLPVSFNGSVGNQRNTNGLYNIYIETLDKHKNIIFHPCMFFINISFCKRKF